MSMIDEILAADLKQISSNILKREVTKGTRTENSNYLLLKMDHFNKTL
jgi:hypothetical protein